MAKLSVSNIDTVTASDNFSIAATVSSKILTVALKGVDGNDPSPSNQVSIKFRSVTLTDSKPVTRIVSSALSVALSSGSTLGLTRSYGSAFPPAYNATYVKATTEYAANYEAFRATNPATSLTGAESTNIWNSGNTFNTNQRFHIDLGSAKVIRRIYLENGHNSGGNTTQGVKNFTVQGSNDAGAFAALTYATNTNWTNITASIALWAQHTAADTPDPQYAILTNAVAYRYYAIKFVDNWGYAAYMSARRIELQEETTPPTRIYVWGIDNAGTIEMALSKTADIFPEMNLATTVAEGGAGAADSASVMYSATQRTGIPCKCLGYIEVTSGAVLGEWDNAPSKVQVMGPGVKRTGDIVQVQHYQTGEVASGTTVIPDDDTIPLITEGFEVMTLAVTPTSAANKLLITARVNLYASAGDAQGLKAALFQDAIPNALAVAFDAASPGYNAAQSHITLGYLMLAGGVVASTFRIRVGGGSGTITFNGAAAARKYGGVFNSGITVQEIMA